MNREEFSEMITKLYELIQDKLFCDLQLRILFNGFTVEDLEIMLGKQITEVQKEQEEWFQAELQNLLDNRLNA